MKMSDSNGGVAVSGDVDQEAVAANAITEAFAQRAARRVEHRVSGEHHVLSPRTHSIQIFRVPRSVEESHKRKFVPDTLFLGLFSHLDSNYHLESATQFKVDVIDECIDIMNFQQWTTGGDTWDWEKLKRHVVGENERAEARTYYDLNNSHDKSTDVERHVLALDSIFLCCYLYAYFIPHYYPSIRGIVSSRSLSFHQRLMNDIVKLQNQIPLFLISRVAKIISLNSDPDQVKSNPDQELNDIYMSWILHHSASLPGITSNNLRLKTPFRDCHHLLECLCQVMDSNPEVTSGPYSRPNESPEVNRRKKPLHRESNITGWIGAQFTGEYHYNSDRHQVRDYHKEISLPPASVLRKGGIHFRGRGGDSVNLVPKFSPGFMNISATLHIPAFSVSLNTELLWRNMIAYIHEGKTLESAVNGAADFINFLMFMDEMVDTEQDVALLRYGKHRVIQKNMLGTNQEVADLLNKIVQQQEADSIIYGAEWQSLRSQISTFYTRRKRVVLLEFLRYNFGKPWFVISILVGSFILCSTFLQTFYTILSYYKP